jgi:hypothetical protein
MGDAGRSLTNFRRGIADPAETDLVDPGPPPPAPGA